MIRLLVAIGLGRLVGRLSRLVGRGGSAIPGLVVVRIAPRAIEGLVGGLCDGVVLITGTNGKTTTTKMIVSALEADGRRVVTNRSGSNLERGIVTALVQMASWRGSIDADVAVFEADEAAVRGLSERVSPRLVVVTNLARDQLDRFGELDTVAGHVEAALAHADGAVLNADDPLVVALGTSGDVSYFGAVEPIRRLMPSDEKLHPSAVGDERHGERSVEVSVEVIGARSDGVGQVVTLAHDDGDQAIRLNVPGTYNAYNAAAALAASLRLGVSAAVTGKALEMMEAPFGRGQVIEHRGRRVIVVLVKNPAGFNQAIRILTRAPAPGPVLVAINDEIADGRDVSWLWDSRVEELGSTDHRFGSGGTRAADMTLRFKYAGIDAWSEPDLARAVDRVVSSVAEGDTVYIIPTYTAMLALLDILIPGAPRHEVWT